jgi:hypothetical protein
MNAMRSGKIERATADKGGYLGQHRAPALVFRLGSAKLKRKSDVECSEKSSGTISKFVNIPAVAH